MAVNLSPVGGVAAQFFDNSGNVLTGGRLYTYAAGTTTPAVTYTTSAGVTQNSNPIVLDAAGRVSNSGEIWLADGISYKFVLQDQFAVQIATWDNITGINSNFINYSLQTDVQIATQGQTIFNLVGIVYQPVTNSLSIFVNGSRQIITDNYIETNSTTVTFVDGLNVGDVVEFITATSATGNATTAQNVSYNEGQPGAVDRTVAGKLQESVSLADFGAVGNGITNDQVAVDNTINCGLQSIYVNDNAKFLINTFSNDMGVALDGYGAIVTPVTGGIWQRNSYGDKYQYVFGQEYMAYLHNILIYLPVRSPIIVFSGDSTTAGDAVTVDYQISNLVNDAGNFAGLQTAFGLTCLNNGHSGAQISDWIDTYLAQDLADNPDLYVIRWGINDGGNQDPAGFISLLREGLATIRASRSVADLSILLMSPNATADSTNNRDEYWNESISAGIKQAARDYQCTYIDTYAYLRDARHAADIWMDNPMPVPDNAIHPLAVMNTWIAGIISSVAFPVGLQAKICNNSFLSIGGGQSQGDVTALPSTYAKGVTVSRGTAIAAGFPLDGQVVTVVGQDGIVRQTNYGYDVTSTSVYYWRIGRTAILAGNPAGWDAWNVSGTGSKALVTAAAGFSNANGSNSMRTVLTNGIVTMQGFITVNTPATIGANTVFGTIAANCVPVVDNYYGFSATLWNSSAFEPALVKIDNLGIMSIVNATSLASTSRIYCVATWSIAPV